MATISTLRCYPLFRLQTSTHQIPSKGVLSRTELTSSHGRPNWNRFEINREVAARAVGRSLNSGENQGIQDDSASKPVESTNPVSKFRGSVSALPPVVFVMKKHAASKSVIGLCVAVAILAVAIRVYIVRKTRYSRPGSVADLVRRGQLRSDRQGISKALKYEDPFNNPYVKIGKSSSTIEMCGKVYKLTPVTLTKEEQATHQKRRSRAYQWKRPKVFLKEGDSIPSDVDPDTVRWIPANHPFATTASEIDEDLAQNNVYQKHGVPFRIQAEHEALQKKLEALQNEDKFDDLMIENRMARDVQRPFKLSPKSDKCMEKGSVDNQADKPNLSKDGPANLARSNSPGEETPKSSSKFTEM